MLLLLNVLRARPVGSNDALARRHPRLFFLCRAVYVLLRFICCSWSISQGAALDVFRAMQSSSTTILSKGGGVGVVGGGEGGDGAEKTPAPSEFLTPLIWCKTITTLAQVCHSILRTTQRHTTQGGTYPALENVLCCVVLCGVGVVWCWSLCDSCIYSSALRAAVTHAAGRRSRETDRHDMTRCDTI